MFLGPRKIGTKWPGRLASTTLLFFSLNKSSSVLRRAGLDERSYQPAGGSEKPGPSFIVQTKAAQLKAMKQVCGSLKPNQFCISSDDPPQEFEIAYLAWIGGNTDAARQLMDESFQTDYKVLEFKDFDQIPNAMRTVDVNDFVGSKCISVMSTFNANSGIHAPKRKSKYWAEFLSAFVELDGSPKGLHLVFSGERSHNALVRTVKKSESWEIHSTIYVPEQVEKFRTPPLHERPLVHFDIVYAAMDDDEEDVEKHFASVTGQSGSLKSFVLSKDYQQDMESWGRQCGDFNLDALKAMLGPFLRRNKAVINITAGPNVTYFALVRIILFAVSFRLFWLSGDHPIRQIWMLVHRLRHGFPPHALLRYLSSFFYRVISRYGIHLCCCLLCLL